MRHSFGGCAAGPCRGDQPGTSFTYSSQFDLNQETSKKSLCHPGFERIQGVSDLYF